ncbi:haloacid dehalogenase-like hydrolase [Pleurocapsa sp. FMAR1]|uniref:haloacid dehalogenase-like hydrolase n=1 Tax=Pleurocapsa sp. FMAR1 TaxID=3040204 RepID=UPI0029C6F378|nr:haloacid dehalogenase-like hydrolase [Pleurocapsa sp. FMAR1]
MHNNSIKKCNLSENIKVINLIKNAAQNTPIILDFDETLLLRNSTAEYINSLRPRLIGFILVSILKVFRPWLWLPQPFRGDKIRDWFLVVIPTILLPWTLFLWQKKAQKLAQNQGNLELIEAVKQNCDSPIIIASLGFNFVINPILKHLSIRYDRLVGCRFWQGASDRHQGKLLMMRSVLSESQIHSAIVVTDSEDDIPLLQVVAHPCLLVWSSAKYIDPFSDFWLFNLLRKIKK